MVVLGISRKKHLTPPIGAQKEAAAFGPGLRRSKEEHSIGWKGTMC